MMNEIKIFNNGDFGEIRTIMVDGEPYFVAKDICDILELTNTTVALGKLDDDEKEYVILGQQGKTNVVNERGMSSLIVRCNKISTKNKENILTCLQKLGYCNNMSLYSRSEVEFGECLRETLLPFNLDIITQHNVLNYRTDFYIPKLNIVVEYDENNHNHYDIDCEEQRVADIKGELNCEIIRVNDSMSHNYNCGLVMKQIIELGDVT